MKKLIYTFVIVLVVGTLNAQWVQVPSGTIENLNDIQFVDANTGFAVGDIGVVLKTTNGGQNWVSISTGNYAKNYCLFFTSATSGFIGTTNGELIRTTNSGISWDIISPLQYANTYIIRSIYFTSTMTGFLAFNYNVASPYGNMLYKTTNGGLNWSFTSGEMQRPSTSIFFINPNYGWVICNYPQNTTGISRTTNGGLNWDTWENTSYNWFHINSIHFFASTIGYASADSGKIFKTTNGGVNWTNLGSYSSHNLNSIKAIDVYKAVTVGNSGVIKATSNGGTTWFNQNSTTSNNLNSLYMVNSTTGFVAGDVGTILKTTNGGTYIKKIEEIIPNNYELQQNYPNPFNPRTTIRFSIPKQSFVKITVYNLNGKIISTLVENVLSTGTYETTFDASEHSSGVYYIKFDAGNTSITKKMSLIK